MLAYSHVTKIGVVSGNPPKFCTVCHLLLFLDWITKREIIAQGSNVIFNSIANMEFHHSIAMVIYGYQIN